ncbi:AraC family transcriptional regulator N-terminal domain-containing protein [Undibacterium sp.]|uniref:AraC family transcriptional regulator n=1 Tax=Undibacterium sp. TaxID=1914977 RepID=UPI00374C8FA5
MEKETRQQRMIELMGKLAPCEGQTLSPLDRIKFMRASKSLPRTPVLYEPSLVVVCQGRKRGFLGEQSFIYDAQQFLVLSVPLPFESETIASVEEPLLAVSIRINLAVAAEVVLSLDESHHHSSASPVGMCATPLDDKLGDAVLRLLETLTSPTDTRILGAAIMREIYFRVLTGEQGPSIRSALTHQSHFGKISKALRRIHTDYAGGLDVDTLATEAGMSVAAFHANFKGVTTTSPMQYLKTTRLHKARLLMIQDGLSAATAAGRVGYESTSQFSREFKRFFGRTPMEEATQMKNLLIEMPAENNARYVTVQ